MPTKHPIEKQPDFDFKSVHELSHLTIEQKEKLLSDIEYILGECELSREMILKHAESEGFEPDLDWCKRVNYKIGIKRNQKKILANHLRVIKGHTLMGTFHDVAKILLPEETYKTILSKSKEIVNKQEEEVIYE